MGQNFVVPNAIEPTRVLGVAMPTYNRSVGEGTDVSALSGTSSEFRRADLKREDLSGIRLGSYDLSTKLGEGGMGTLFRARHRQLGKACAVKFIHPSMATNAQAISRFLQEIRAVGQLNHANIVCALDADCVDGVHYYVTELLEGQDLQRCVSLHGPIELNQSFAMIRQVLDGLAHAHERGFVHRDIKPSNIFLTESGSAKLLDFGLARNTQQTCEGLTSSEQLLGTLDYLAPEQAENPTQANAASDIYSLGLTWIYLLSGQSPFPDSQYSTTVSKLRGQLVDQPEWLARNPLALPTEVVELISAMIAKDPAARTRGCREAISRLDACCSLVSGRSSKDLNSTAAPRSNARQKVMAGCAGAIAVAIIAGAILMNTTASKAVKQSEATNVSTAHEAIATVEPESVKPESVAGTNDQSKHDATNLDTARTLSSAKPAASAKVTRRSGPAAAKPTTMQLFPLSSDKN